MTSWSARMNRLWMALTVFGVAVSTATSAAGQTRPPTGPGPPSSLPADDAATARRIAAPLRLLHDLARDDIPDPPFASIDGAQTVDVLIRHRCRPQTLDPLTDPDRTAVDLGSQRLTGTAIRWNVLDRLATTACIRRVEPARLPGNLAPLEETTDAIGARAAHYRPDGQVDGDGTTIALLDSPVDILHPAFFRPDAGRYVWLDVDGDGAPTPGTDAIDLDGDGEADHNETLRVLDATTVVDFSSEHVSNDDGLFQPDRDWLYVDLNGDGRRNAGQSEGFRESDPAYGEPTFVADDVDRDGTLGVREPLYRLGTSKIQRMVRADGTYRRGENLIAAVDGSLPPRSRHGTSVAGVLVGGQLGFHRRVGVAPRADLAVFGYPREMEDEQTRHLEALREAREMEADVFLSEWTNPFVRPLDGSTNLEAAMSDARDDGLAQVVPVGNLNRSGKHLQRRVGAGETVQLRFEVPQRVEHRGTRYEVGHAFGSLQWRADDKLRFSITAPGTEAKKIPKGRDQIAFDEFELRWSRDRTPGGTRMVIFYLRTTDGGSTALPDGEWSFTVEGASEPIPIYGRITDDHTGWDPGVRWSEPTVGETTVSYPATADAAIGVAAYAGREPTGDETRRVGDLRPFSGRGPRIDGAPVVDIAAPDNPFVPIAATPRVVDSGWGRSWFHMFGGSSGAAPHVAGSLALLREAAPEASPASLERRLQQRADRSELSPAPDAFPDPGWGHGRLRTYRSLHDAESPANAPPRAKLTIEIDGPTATFDGTGSSDPDGDPLEYRFDLDHDGRWETDWRSNGRVERRLDAIAPDQGLRVSRLEIRDAHGARAGALADLPTGSTGDDSSTDAEPGTDVAAVGDTATSADADGSPPDGPFTCSAPGDSSPPGRLACLFGLLVLTSLIRLRR